MKKIFLLLLIPLFSVFYSQQITNRFDQEEHVAVEKSTEQSNNQNLDEGDGPTDPPNPVPIDDYIPFLAITALGLIFYHFRKQKQLR